MGLTLLERPDGDVEVRCDGPKARLSAAMGLLNVVTAEVVAAITAALETGGWQGDGITTPEQWVALRCGVSSSRARRLVALAEGLGELPAATAAFGKGSLSEDQVGLVCAYADPANDAEATALARRSTVGQLRRVLPSIARATPAPDPIPDGPPLAGEDGDAGSGAGDTPGRRETSFGNAEDGRWWARILLPPDEGALVQKALEASRDALFRVRHPDVGGGVRPNRVATGWSDALVHLAEAALSNIEGAGRLPADRFQVILHVDADDPGRARLHLGPLLPASLRDYLACDAAGRVVLEGKGTPVHVFARQRTVDDRLRALIERRDEGCRVPGCGQRGGCTSTTSCTTRTAGSPSRPTCAACARPTIACTTPGAWASPATPPPPTAWSSPITGAGPSAGPAHVRPVPRPPRRRRPWACPTPAGIHRSASVSTPGASPGTSPHRDGY